MNNEHKWFSRRSLPKRWKKFKITRGNDRDIQKKTSNTNTLYTIGKPEHFSEEPFPVGVSCFYNIYNTKKLKLLYPRTHELSKQIVPS